MAESIPIQHYTVMFDFDNTLIDENTDTYIVEQLWPELMIDLKNWRHSGVSWTEIMRRILNKLLTKFTIEDLTNCFKKIRMNASLVQMLKSFIQLKDQIDVYIVSDANDFFIHTILQNEGIDYTQFKFIHTNITKLNVEQNTIDLTEYSIYFNDPHNCTDCPDNMCKGHIVKEIMESSLKEENNCCKCNNRTFIYVGDGKNDFCGSSQLRECDYLLCRIGRSLEEKIKEFPNKLLNTVYYWNDEEEMVNHFVKIGVVTNNVQ
ncbi:hypothetical protein ABK040_004068 [Willaertia magna]